MAYTNNFSRDNLIGEGSHGNVYHGRLHDGREVAVKRMVNMQLTNLQEDFDTELAILSRLRHKHIIRLLGSCVTLSKDKRLQATTLKKKKGLLKRWRMEPKEPESPEVLKRHIVYEYMENGTLFDHLHSVDGSSDMSPVTSSWKIRINVLLGVSRAMEHLHCHANPPIIHRDTKSANILLDANWVPRVSDFGLSVTWDTASDESAMQVYQIVGTHGYMAPEYVFHGLITPAIDVYSLGVMMLEVLTGKNAYSEEVTFADLAIVPCHLDMRPVPEPTPWQLQALKRVAWTARCCVKLDAKDRMAISEVAANLEKAHELICRDEPVDELDLFDELPDSPRASSVSSEGYRSDLVHYKPIHVYSY
jgi:serine/threonine protein kinase